VSADNLLEIRGLSVDYATRRGPVHALRRLDLDIRRDGVVGIVGESGCGKSTLISAILSLLPSNAAIRGGSIHFADADLLSLSGDELRAVRGQRIATVFQDPMTSLNPVVSIATQLIDVQYRLSGSKAEKRRRAIAMLGRVGIPDPEHRIDEYPHRFSGGMRQRIAIAMALLVSPMLLIADEPTTALDVTLEAQIMHLFKELRAEFGCSMLFVSHNLGLIAELCDEVVVMYAGEVVERGDVRSIFHDPRHPYTRLLLACDPARIEPQRHDLPTIPGSVPDLARVPAGCVFAARCSSATAACRKERPRARRVHAGHEACCLLVCNDE
jgi:oligopeptide/dipeptide ABC transporter ATP-binding protein